MEREFYYSKDGTKVMVVAPIGELESIADRMERFKYKYDHMLVIGNGFDLNLGLRTTYRDFVNSRIFKRVYVKRMKEKNSKGNPSPSLIDYLYGKKFIEKWYDIEEALLEYVSPKPDGSFVNNVEIDRRDYEHVSDALIEYLASLFKTGDNLRQANKMEASPAGKLLKSFSSEKNIIYSFNYTPIHIIINNVFAKSSIEAVRVHGKIEEETIFKGNIEDNHIILGIETNDISKIAPGYTFLLKSNNPIYKSTFIASDLLNTEHVIFYGHSLNKMDFGYFREFFNCLASNQDTKRKLTIFTKNKESRVSLLDNLRMAGVSVRDIFAHTNVEIILTDDIGRKDTESEKRFYNLLERIETNLYR